MTPEQRAQIEPLAVIEGTDFSNGVIEAEIAGPGTVAHFRNVVVTPQ